MYDTKTAGDLEAIRSIKKRTIARIMSLIQPHLYEGGFVIGDDSRPLKLYPFPKPFRLCGEEIQCVTQSGIVTDSGGIVRVHRPFRDLDAEHLLKLEASLRKHLPKGA